MTNTTIGRTDSLSRLLAVALVVVLACGGLALTARPSEAALRAFNGGSVSSGDGDYAAHPANATAIPIPAGGPASLYPSQIDVSGVSGSVSYVTVRLDNYGHTWPDDVDVMLAGPGGQKVMLMSDAGGDDTSPVSDRNLQFSDNYGPLPDGGGIPGTLYRPTDHEPGETMPAPAPAGPYATSLSAFNGTNPNGAWKLYVSDDNAAGDSGSIAGGWRLTINTVGGGDPYPSQVNVSGFSGPVTDLDLVLNNFSHPSPDDLDVMLVGPGAQRSLVMSDVGGLAGVTSLNLTLNDEAANQMPDGAALATGAYKPTNVDGIADFPDIFPAPAPAPGGSELSAFDGTNPNGTWSLYVVDDLAGFTGGFTGWSLRVTANEAPNAANDAFAVKEDKTLNRGVLGNDADLDGDTLTAVRVSGPRHGRLTLGANGSFAYRPDRNFNGRDSFVYEALDGSGGTDRATVNIRVRAVPR